MRVAAKTRGNYATPEDVFSALTLSPRVDFREKTRRDRCEHTFTRLLPATFVRWSIHGAGRKMLNPFDFG